MKGSASGIIVEMYTKEECPLCLKARKVLLKVQQEIPFELREVDIESDQALYERFKFDIPVVFINGKRCFTYRVNEKELKEILIKWDGNT